MSAMDVFWAAPPITRTVTAAVLVTSLACYGGAIDAYPLAFIPSTIFTFRRVPQIWRFITPFLLTKPKLSMLMDPYFLYTYSSQLETGGTRFSRPGEFAIYLAFVCGVIVLTGGFYLGAGFFLQALILALASTAAQENPEQRLTYFVITFAMKWLPLAMLFMTFAVEGVESVKLQATGLIAAHAYDFLVRVWPEHGGGRTWIQTPEVVARWFALPPGTAQVRGHGTAFQANTSSRSSAGASGSGASWSSGSSWGSRGTGRRLGSD